MAIDTQKLHSFHIEAGENGYMQGKGFVSPEEVQRPGFKEIVYTSTDGNWVYRDSYTGHFRSRGDEVIYFQGKPVWVCSYGGGMVEEKHGDEDFTDQTFKFLRRAISSKSNQDSFSARGPAHFQDGDWEYTYYQEGNMDEFSGYEEIKFQGQRVFFHQAIGGKVVHHEL